HASPPSPTRRSSDLQVPGHRDRDERGGEAEGLTLAQPEAEQDEGAAHHEREHEARDEGAEIEDIEHGQFSLMRCAGRVEGLQPSRPSSSSANTGASGSLKTGL